MRVDLCWLGSSPPTSAWSLGRSLHVAPSPREIARVMEQQAIGDSDATLFWDGALGAPAIDERWLAERRCEVLHAGLALGTSEVPQIIDFIEPVWIWNTNPPPDIEATSWRLSLRACLIRHDVIRQLGGVRPEFLTLEGAALELGHRYLTRGAFVRHDPTLLPASFHPVPPQLPVHDEVLFARHRYGDFWARWGLGRGIVTGAFRALDAATARSAFSHPLSPRATYVREERPVEPPRGAKVTVLIPTIERYPWLRPLLPQLAAQTYPVHEIVIIDQTPVEKRDERIAADFADLPIRVIYRDTPGQCSARNDGLRHASGDYVLFLDDDDEVQPDLVERHLRSLATWDVDVSCGVSEEVGAGPVPEGLAFLRASDVFSTNNSMVRRRVLDKSGMFDLAYDCKQCEDGDLGTRLYLAGVLMVVDARIRVLHHRAPRGGLREHAVRAVTYASSRTKVTHRNLPNMSEVYMGLRYFTARQVREMLVLRTFGTLRGRGNPLQQALKAAYGLAVLPDTMRRVRQAESDARGLLETYPQIDPLP